MGGSVYQNKKEIMKNSSLISTLIIVAALGTPLVYLAAIYQSLPQIVPTHFNIEGKADGFGEKSTLLFTTILLNAVGLGTYFLL